MKKAIFGILGTLLFLSLVLAVFLINDDDDISTGEPEEETKIVINEPGSIDKSDTSFETNTDNNLEDSDLDQDKTEEMVIPVPDGKTLVTVETPQIQQEVIALDETTYHENITDLNQTSPKLAFADISKDQSLINNLNGSLNYLYDYSLNYTKDQIGIVTDPASLYVLCNKLNRLPADYVPVNLVIPDIRSTRADDVDKRYVREEMAKALEGLFAAAEEEGLYLFAASGYRSYATQESVYNSHVASKGLEAADKVSARPGHSEHQTGLAMDVTIESLGYKLEESLGLLPEGIFLAQHAHEYGLIIRYPEDKVDITGYNYEPWHLRYVGLELATFLYDNQLTLEEFDFMVQSQAYLYIPE